MAIAQSRKDAWGFGVPWQAGDTTSHANLEGSLDGTLGGVPILWGAASEGPASAATSGTLPGMILCPANGVDIFAIFNRNDGSYNMRSVPSLPSQNPPGLATRNHELVDALDRAQILSALERRRVRTPELAHEPF